MGAGTAGYWEYANSPMIQQDGRCNKCEDSTTHEADPPAGAPPQTDVVIVCEGCDRVVDAR